MVAYERALETVFNRRNKTVVYEVDAYGRWSLTEVVAMRELTVIVKSLVKRESLLVRIGTSRLRNSVKLLSLKSFENLFFARIVHVILKYQEMVIDLVSLR